MKLKDIEKNLKREQDGKSVPDVYARVKKAPLNKLLTGETPIKAFQKKMVMTTLVIVLLLFLVAAIALSALWFLKSNTTPLPDCYVSVTVEREGGDLRIGALIRPDYDIVSVVLEIENGEMLDASVVAHSSQITDFIEPNSNDKVSIKLFCDDVMRAYYLARMISEQIETLYADAEYDVVARCNDYVSKIQWVEYINARGGNSTSVDGVDELISEYASLL